jgi:two-component sensor histidine kinase
LRRVAEGHTVSSRYRIRRQPDEEVRWLVSHDFPIPDSHGRTRWIGGIAHDFTDEKAMADRLHVLLAELQHRTRNLIGVIRAIATRTAADAGSLQSFTQSFTARLDALARVNGLLSRLEDGDRVSFDELLRTEFAAHGVADENGVGDQVTLKGRRGIRLRSASIQTFGLALHELTTNAVKYGALSTPDGHVDVTWRLISTDDGEQRLRVEWRETGSPGFIVSTRKGYGRELIERALPHQLAAETHYELGPDGVRCTITAPVSTTYGASA